jgi:hypothetical protein
MRGLGRYWGYLLFIVVLTLWWTTEVGPIVIAVLFAVTTAYFVFGAPVWCGAMNRDDTLCRNNASGLLLGCSIRQHKYQKLKMTVVPHAWRQLNKGLWANPSTCLATVSTALGIISTVVALVSSLFIRG